MIDVMKQVILSEAPAMTARMRRRTYWTATGVLLATVAMGLMATGGGKAATKAAPPPTPEVSVIHAMDEDVATYREYPARTYARDLVEVRGRVDDYVDRRTFDIASDIRAGQVLYVLIQR
jgi:multidrug efflux pump subunit AcrA (membrane-fusion protein)